MTTILALILFLVFLLLSAVHFFWILRGRTDGRGVFPTKDDSVSAKMPGVVPTLVVAFSLLAVALFMLVKAGLLNISIPLWLNTYGLWILAAAFIIRAIGEFRYVGFFKKIKHTTFGQNDTKYYSPLCLVIGVLIVVLQMSGMGKM